MSKLDTICRAMPIYPNVTKIASKKELVTVEQEKFVIEITRDQAVALCLLNGGGYAQGRGDRAPDSVLHTIVAVSDALDLADSSLHQEQFNIWKNLATLV